MKTRTLTLTLIIMAAMFISCQPANRTAPAPSAPIEVDSTISQVAVNIKEPAKQCRAITGKGKRCIRKTSDPTGLCWQHNPRHASNSSIVK